MQIVPEENFPRGGKPAVANGKPRPRIHRPQNVSALIQLNSI